MAKLLWPGSIAVIGASSDTRGLRGRLLEVIRGHPYAGRIYPVSRSASEVQGLRAYASVADLPEPADLALIIIPARYVPAELERCGAAGVKAAVILSAGFAEEPGADGERLQAEIARIARRFDMAVVGPNSEGFANVEASLCATFSPVMDRHAGALRPRHSLGGGQVSVISQSGGLGFAFFDRARWRRVAFRHVVTTGNEAALEVADVLDYALDEGGTDVFLLLIEDVKSPEKFKRVARKALRLRKPLVIGKIGQSEAGRRAAMSHTAALAGSHAAYRAIFQHYGLIEGRDLDDMLDMAIAFLTCGDRLPAGRRMAVCTSSGGAGVWMADACAAAGLDIPVLDAATRRAIDAHIPAYGTSQNPIDSTAQGVQQLGYAAFARLAAGSPLIDGVIVVVTARRSAFLERDLQPLKDLRRESGKPVFMWTYTLPSDRSTELLCEAGYPLFTSAAGCARAMRALADYRMLRDVAAPEPAHPAISPAARAAVHAGLRADADVLPEWRARPLLAAYGVGGADAGVLARSAEEAETAVRGLGGAAALKVQSVAIPHKTEAGAVALNVTADAARAAYERVLASARRHAPRAPIDGVLVQRMAEPGREVILGITRDQRWGPLLMVGLGGIAAEALGDVAFAPVPLEREAALRLIGSLKSAAILGAHRGAAAADIDALADAMVRLSHFAADHAEEIAEIDLNPVIVHPKGISVVDALIIKRAPGGTRAAAE
ncbi:MAG: acetate--CoA ligase family protein [Pseudolabrys sp.]|nr:acetate--CoA ligase family protein [Pseudolabrys sp.]